MSLFRRSLTTRSSGFASGDFIPNSVTAGLGMLEIGARQLNNWRPHEPPTSFPSASHGPRSTCLHNSLLPRHHFRLPGRFRIDEENKNRTTGIVKKKTKNWNLCVTSKIYLERYNANWNLKFKPLKLQDVISLWALESHKNSIPINCDKFPKITATWLFFQSQNFTLCSYFLYHFFLYLEFWYTSFFYSFVTLQTT